MTLNAAAPETVGAERCDPRAANPHSAVLCDGALNKKLRRECAHERPLDDGQQTFDDRTDIEHQRTERRRKGDEGKEAHDAFVEEAGELR